MRPSPTCASWPRPTGRSASAGSSPHRPGGARASPPRLVTDALARTAPATAVLDAQSHLTGWYEGFGFEIAGAEYLDDGIPHTPMRLVRSSC